MLSGLLDMEEGERLLPFVRVLIRSHRLISSTMKLGRHTPSIKEKVVTH